MDKHLWEIDHPYYCNESNYYARESVGDHHKTWADFFAEYADADLDMNLLFRFDWVEGEDHDLQPFNGDVYYRNGILKIFWIGQRKGLCRYSTIEVCRADEEQVKDFLRPRWGHIVTLWEGIGRNPSR